MYCCCICPLHLHTMRLAHPNVLTDTARGPDQSRVTVTTSSQSGPDQAPCPELASNTTHAYADAMKCETQRKHLSMMNHNIVSECVEMCKAVHHTDTHTHTAVSITFLSHGTCKSTLRPPHAPMHKHKLSSVGLVDPHPRLYQRTSLSPCPRRKPARRPRRLRSRRRSRCPHPAAARPARLASLV